jgi:surfactin family lipopeptide synthetase C
MLKNVADIYALTPMQELMLLHALTSGRENDVLFNQIVYELTGALDEAALQGAWQHLVDRHPVLRTIFVWQKSQNPVQVVRETTILPWKRLDWSAEDPAMWPEKLTATLEADRAEGFRDDARAVDADHVD